MIEIGTLNSSSIQKFNLRYRRINRIVFYCQQNPNIVYIVNALGPWQLELDIEIKNIIEFRSLIRDFLNKFADVVSDYSALNI